MKDSFRFRYYSVLCLVCLVGCFGGDFVPVSGVVTIDGEPKENVRVVFAPMATEETNTPGPPSLGVTDAEGRYELETRDGYRGAVVGKHNVTFTYADLEHLEDLRAWRGNADSKEDFEAAKAAIAYVEEQISIRGAISESSMQTIIVPERGRQDADFEIGEAHFK